MGLWMVQIQIRWLLTQCGVHQIPQSPKYNRNLLINRTLNLTLKVLFLRFSNSDGPICPNIRIIWGPPVPKNVCVEILVCLQQCRCQVTDHCLEFLGCLALHCFTNISTYRVESTLGGEHIFCRLFWVGIWVRKSTSFWNF